MFEENVGGEFRGLIEDVLSVNARPPELINWRRSSPIGRIDGRLMEDGMRQFITRLRARQAEIIGRGVVLKVLLASLVLALIAWVILGALYT